MRILHLVSYSLFSGPLPPTLQLALAQRRLGHTVWLAYDRKRGNFNGYEEAAADHVEAHGLTPPIPLTLSAKSSPTQLWQDVRQLRRFCGSGGVDVVHMHLSHDHALMALAGSPPPVRVRTLHAPRSLHPRLGQRWLHRRADAWIVRCAAHRVTFLQRFAATADAVQVIPGSIDCQAFAPSGRVERTAARQALGVPSDVPLLGHVALLADRGQAELLQALQATPHLHVLFVGRGEAEAALRAQCAALQLQGRVHFAGYLQGDKLLQAYAAMDAAFLAQAGNDGSARAAMEAMASGLPLVAVQEGALADLVSPARGYPVGQRDASQIATSLAAWLADMQGGCRRGEAARDHVSRGRQITDEAAQTLQLYRAREAASRRGVC